MKFPNKAIRYNESIVSKFPCIMEQLSHGEMAISDLYASVKTKMQSVSDFIDALDCLYALHKITFNQETRRLAYAV